MENILVGIIVFLAIIYLIQHFRNQFSTTSACAKGCKSCSNIKQLDEVK